LYVEETDDVEFYSYLFGVFVDGINVLCRDADGRNYAGGIARMDAGELYMFHDRGYEGLFSVCQGIGLRFDSVFQEFIDKNWPFGRHTNSGCHIVPEHLLIVDDLHSPSAEHIGGPDHEGISYPFRDSQCLIQGAGHIGLRLRNAELCHPISEAIPVLCQINTLWRCSNDLDPSLGQLISDIERRLPSKLDNYPLWLLLLVYA